MPSHRPSHVRGVSRTASIRVLPLALAAALAGAMLAGCGAAPSADANGAAKAGTAAAPEASAAARVVPAMLAEARAVLDLTAWPLPEGAEVSADANVAALTFRTGGALEAVFAAQRSQLQAKGWTPVGDPQLYPQSASGVFRKAGFTLSLMAMPESADLVTVRLQQHGNIDLSTLAPPAGVDVRFAQAVSALWETETSAEAASAALRDALIFAGWEPYGEAGPMRYYRSNALRLSAMTAASPTPGGRTVHHLGIELLSAQIPAPPAVVIDGFDVGAQALRVFHDGPIDGLVQDYSPVLAALGWQPSLEAPTAVDGKQVMTWRNADSDLLTLERAPPRGAQANVAIAYQTRAQLDAMNRRLDEQAAAYLKAKQAD